MLDKFVPIAFSVCTVLSAALWADQQDQPCCEYDSRTMYDPCPAKDNQFRVFGDFLWWKADVEGTEVGVKGSVISPQSSKNEVLNVEGRWKPGFRLGLGYVANRYDSWDLSLVWTNFQNKSEHVSYSSHAATQYALPFGLSTLGSIALNLKANWKLRMNLIDLELGREFYVTKKISFKPHFGIRGAFFDFDSHQKYKSEWFFFGPLGDPGDGLVDAPFNGDRLVIQNPTSGKADFDYSSVGLKMGIDGSWHFCKNLSLLSKFSASFLYGQYDINQKYNGFEPDIVGDSTPLLRTINFNFHTDMWRLRTEIEAFLGIMWDIPFNNDRCGFNLSIGYEMSQWFQLNETQNLIDVLSSHAAFDPSNFPFLSADYFLYEVSNQGNVSFQGLTVEAGFRF